MMSYGSTIAILYVPGTVSVLHMSLHSSRVSLNTLSKASSIRETYDGSPDANTNTELGTTDALE